MVWPTLEQYTEDAYALDVLGEILSDGKKAPLYRVLVKDKELTSQTTAYNRSTELAGDFRISITANNGVDLDAIESGINDAFALFEKEGVSDRDMERVKAGLETQFYNGISSVLGKSFQLARYNVFTGDPGFITDDIENIKKVTKEDVMRVYEKYIKGEHYVMTSFVPKGQLELIAENSEKANVVEEEIRENVATEIEEAATEIVKTPSNFDRSNPPVVGDAPALNVPEVWTATLENGMKVSGIQHDEIPVATFSLVIEGGHLLDDMEKNGVANLMSDILMEGTATKTPEELEEEIELLGANINMYTTRESIVIRGNTLTRNLQKTMELVTEILLEPRWDEAELARLKTKTINDIERSDANPNVVANRVYNKILYGNDHIFSYPTVGTA